MYLALESFSGIHAERKLVILGDMLELGEKSEEEHYKILNELQSYKVENALLVGPVFQKVSSESGFKSFQNVAMLVEFLKSESVKGNAILIKGSRGMGLEKVYDLL
jgi:UDP-N-acetylmuramoyl-tripeptide--D-alanyl-D-alanine ligase